MTLKLNLAPNQLHPEPQVMLIDKVAGLFGKNGSGKSLILRTIFQQKLNNAGCENLRVVCFSSGQNENYSEEYRVYLDKRSDSGSGFNHDCYYYNKEWSKLLIFLAIVLNPNGSVRNFFMEHSQYWKNSNGKNFDPEIEFLLNVDEKYLEEASKIKEKLARGEVVDSNKRKFFDVLEQFINSEVQSGYEFGNVIDKKSITVSAKRLYDILIDFDIVRKTVSDSFDSSDKKGMNVATRDERVSSAIYFFTEAAFGNRFIEKDKIQLKINKVLEMDELSDGEFQLLFLMALIDLFDAENSFFCWMKLIRTFILEISNFSGRNCIRSKDMSLRLLT